MRRDCCQKRRIACFGDSFSVMQEKMEWKLQDLRFLQILQQPFKILYCVNRDLRKKAEKYEDSSPESKKEGSE